MLAQRSAGHRLTCTCYCIELQQNLSSESARGQAQGAKGKCARSLSLFLCSCCICLTHRKPDWRVYALQRLRRVRPLSARRRLPRHVGLPRNRALNWMIIIRRISLNCSIIICCGVSKRQRCVYTTDCSVTLQVSLCLALSVSLSRSVCLSISTPTYRRTRCDMRHALYIFAIPVDLFFPYLCTIII